MPRHKALAITQHAGLAARAIARLEEAATAVHERETTKRDRAMRLVSTPNGFSAVIRHGKTMIEIAGDEFAVTRTD